MFSNTLSLSLICAYVSKVVSFLRVSQLEFCSYFLRPMHTVYFDSLALFGLIIVTNSAKSINWKIFLLLFDKAQTRHDNTTFYEAVKG
jgi:hypothetical protein